MRLVEQHPRMTESEWAYYAGSHFEYVLSDGERITCGVEDRITKKGKRIVSQGSTLVRLLDGNRAGCNIWIVKDEIDAEIV
jgi:hypothetical protein